MISLIEPIYNYYDDCHKYDDEIYSLIKEGVDLEEADKYGRTAIMIAATYKWGELLYTLVASGANVNAKCNRGMTPLMYLVIPYIDVEDGGYSYNDTPSVKTLLDNGAVPLEKDNYGATAMMYAWCYRSEAALKILEDHLKKGAGKS